MSQVKKPELKLDDQFTFACHSGLECYTTCCRDVNIMLTPNDVIRMKKALGLTSTEFLHKYTDIVVVPGRLMPLVQLRMNEEDNKKCFFVRPHGCLHYEHRPWACRMFPLDERGAGGFTLATEGSRCHGLVKGDSWLVREWLMDQGATQAKESDGSFESLVAHEFMQKMGSVDNPQIQQMLVMSLYDIDRFRDFVFGSSFLERFELEEDQIDAIKTGDRALLDLAFDWVRFGLLGQKSLNLKEEAKKRAEEKNDAASAR